ncbi:helix-turn-helix transcriptional regulator [Ahrensia sp. R2A130]|uniref:helix-turn-helix domain-containing protein n=1 Tax=Ahrensia sp. R2A130 TaxID=744979 RepID=UPI0012EAC748|nr:helix-turn-helix transcriptional regulator [Ahrensia sp. R2A130]
MITGRQSKAARALIGKSQSELSRLASVGTRTVMDFENGVRTPLPATVSAIQAALEAAGIEFIPANGGGAGVRLKSEPAG